MWKMVYYNLYRKKKETVVAAGYLQHNVFRVSCLYSGKPELRSGVKVEVDVLVSNSQ